MDDPFEVEGVEPTIEDYLKLEAEDKLFKKNKAYIYKNYLSQLPDFNDDDLPARMATGEYTEKDKRIESERLRKKWSWYNYQMYSNGMLEKFESVRKELRASTVEDYIQILYLLGFSSKRIYFAVCRDLKKYDVPLIVTMRLVLKVIADFDISRIKREYDKSLTQERMQVFQDLHARVREAEKKTLEIYLKIIGKLQEKLDLFDPVNDAIELDKLMRRIEKYQNLVNECHGVTGSRKATTVAAGKAIEGYFTRMISGMEDDDKKDPGAMMGRLIDADTGNTFELSSGD